MEQSVTIPEEVTRVLETSSIGYLTTISKSGELYSYPIAYYYSHPRVYFVTPVSAAKYKMIKTNPTVSLIVDNKQLTTKACGAMIQGKARIFSVTRTILSVLSVGPKVAGFSKKYPGMLTFYARGKELPDERKLYKYRLIQVDPTKIVYWTGYSFGRYIPPRKIGKTGRLGLGGAKKEEDAKALGGLLGSADEELTEIQGPQDHDWMVRLDTAISSGSLTEEERTLIRSYRGGASGPRTGLEEKRLLAKWKRQMESAR